MNPSVLIIILAADGAYVSLIQAIRETWGKVGPCEILYCYGYRSNQPRPEPCRALEIGDEITCGCEENLRNVHLKTVLTYEHVLKTKQFDYVFRCCCGSYIVQQELLKFLVDKPRERFYCGAVGDYYGIKFASGSGYFLSRDLVKLIVDNKAEILGYGHQDDVSLGAFMAVKNVPIHGSAKRCDDGWEPGHYHYHFRHNVPLMHAIHKRVGQ